MHTLYHDEHFYILILLHAGRIQNHRETQRVGNDRPPLLLKTIDASLAASAEPYSSLLTLAAS